MENRGFDIGFIYKDPIGIFKSPGEFFSKLDKEQKLLYSIIKYAVYFCIAEVIFYFIGTSSLIQIMPKQLLLDPKSRLMLLALSPVLSLLSLFFSYVSVGISSLLTKGNTSFNNIIRVAAPLGFFMIIEAFITALTKGNRLVAAIVWNSISIVYLFILYFALTKSLNASEKRAKIVLTLFALFKVASFILFITRQH